MATRNGEKYIAQQLESILPQLDATDEVIITDDASTDRTVEIVNQYAATRKITIMVNSAPSGVAGTFERSLRRARGELIFLADQDDLWLPHKISVMKWHLRQHDLVVSDCMLVDDKHEAPGRSFFQINNSGRGLFRNLIRNSFMGCCMAFRRNVLERSLPFPADIPMHDHWIGLVAELHFNVKFIPDRLIYHRRHALNASTNGRRSTQTLRQKFMDRYCIVKNLIFREVYAA